MDFPVVYDTTILNEHPFLVILGGATDCSFCKQLLDVYKIDKYIDATDDTFQSKLIGFV